MPTGTYTSKETNLKILQAIAKGYQQPGGRTRKQLARDFHVSEPVISRLVRKYKQRGTSTLEELAVPLRRRENAGRKMGYSPNNKLVPEMLKLQKQGYSMREIGKKVGLKHSLVSYYLDLERLEKAKSSNKTAWGAHRAFAPKIQALRAQGHTYQAISEQLNIPFHAVSKYASPKYMTKATKGEVHVNGNASNEGLDRKILLGVALAETERFIANLGERLGLDAIQLRSRLSELLEHSPVRGSRGHGDQMSGL